MSKSFNRLSYEECVQLGKEKLEDVKSAKYDLCCLTERVCDIRRGGHGQKKIYSMAKFAKDIGMSVNTLRKWMEEHRNIVKKLEKRPETKEELNAVRAIMNKVNNRTSTSEVQKIYAKELSKSPVDRSLIRLIREAKGMRNFVIDHSLTNLDQEDLKTLEKLLQFTLDKIKEGRETKKS